MLCGHYARAWRGSEGSNYPPSSYHPVTPQPNAHSFRTHKINLYGCCFCSSNVVGKLQRKSGPNLKMNTSGWHSYFLYFVPSLPERVEQDVLNEAFGKQLTNFNRNCEKLEWTTSVYNEEMA